MWLDRYSPPSRITVGGAFQLFACADAASGARRVVAVASPGTEAASASGILDEVARVHGLLDAPRVPKVAERGVCGDVHFLAFDCDATRTIDELWRVQAAIADEKMRFEIGLPLADVLARTMEHVHAVTDPATGRPVAMGAWTWANVLAAPSGAVWLIGFGHHLSNALVEGQPALGTAVFHAPELLFGAPPSPATDVFGFTMLLISLLPYAQLPPGMDALASGRMPEDPEVGAALTEVRSRALAGVAEGRYATMAERNAAFDRLWAAMGLETDPEATRAWIAGLVAVADERPELGDGEPPAPEPGVTIQGRYRIERLLGEGAHGTVFLARDRQLREKVALKVVHVGASSVRRERIAREVRILRSVRHPNLLRGYDLVETRDGLMIVMAYVAGQRLDHYLDTRPDARSATPSLLAGVADGLQALHDRGVIHRDVKPANIVVTRDRVAVLVDFGVAAEAEAGGALTRTEERLGTPLYMSPEQHLGHDVGPEADVYSLGLVALHAWTGRAPLEGLTVPTPHAMAARTAEAMDAAELPPGLRRALELALSPVPEARPSAGDLARLLRRDGRTSATGPAGPAAEAPTADLVVGEDGRWFHRPPEAPQDLSRRGPLRRLLRALAERRIDAPGEAISTMDLLDIGWPDDPVMPDVGARRVYVALSTLRKLGLRDVLISQDEGYLFAPALRVGLSSALRPDTRTS